MRNNKAVVFARVSSKAQEDEGYSLNAQLKLMRQYCKAERLNVISEFTIAETASKDVRRKVFRELLSYLSKNKVQHLVVEKTDRLTRNFRDAVTVDDWLEANEHRQLHMVKEGLVVHRNAKSDAKLMWNIYLAIAKKYTDNLREEAMKGWGEKLAQGWMPAPPPPGYKTVTESYKKIHIIDEETAFLVRRAFTLYLEPGQSSTTIADEMERCGLVTRTGRPLQKSAIHKMLRNTFYVGIIQFNGKQYPGAHEPLLEDKLFNAVQKKLGERNVSTVHHDPLLKSMLRCDVCQKAITWQLQKGRFYGACSRKGDECKKFPFLKEDYVEAIIDSKLREIDSKDSDHARFGELELLLQNRRQPYVGEHRLQLMKLLGRQITRTETMIDNLYDDKLAGLITDQTYTHRLDELNDKLTILRSRIVRLETIEGKTKADIVQPSSLLDLYNAESKHGKRFILDHLFNMKFEEGAVKFTLQHKT